MNAYYCRIAYVFALPISLILFWGEPITAQNQSKPAVDLAPAATSTLATKSIRVATFNVSMNRTGATRLTEDLNRQDPQIQWIAAIIRNVKPDVILLNEIDYSTAADNAKLFNELFLSDSKPDKLGGGPHPMPHIFTAPVNTGVPSGLDLNNNDRKDDPEDAWGFGRYPGQYGMAVLSRFEIDQKASRTFQNLLWAKLDGAFRPMVPETGKPYYSDEVWQQLRLSSKSFWDVVIKATGKELHLLASHPTPPAFDGPEDRNGCRNQDEIRLLVDYISSKNAAANDYFVDDQGRKGGLVDGGSFVVAGDLNADPVDGSNRSEWIHKLLQHPRVAATPIPQSDGAVQAAEKQAQKNKEHKGNPAQDTGDFNDQVVGNLRIDYVLPSGDLKILRSGVVWPKIVDSASKQLIEQINAASDHHMVWVDIQLP
ncbi:MAG: endonuclease/exonuclease/phosphatase family protein [Pirellulales bacterium]